MINGIATALLIFVFIALYKAIGIIYDRLFRKKRFNEVANAGYSAFQEGMAIEVNPHQANSLDYDYWNRGYLMAKRRMEKAKL